MTLTGVLNGTLFHSLLKLYKVLSERLFIMFMVKTQTEITDGEADRHTDRLCKYSYYIPPSRLGEGRILHNNANYIPETYTSRSFQIPEKAIHACYENFVYKSLIFNHTKIE